jgi:hypothetical protein
MAAARLKEDDRYLPIHLSSLGLRTGTIRHV